MDTAALKRIRVLVNRRSGLRWSFEDVQNAVDAAWETGDREITYQFTHGIEDGVRKAHRAVDEGIDLLLVVGGDGTVSNIGRVLVGTDVCLGTIPVGSGNGLARHFGVPLNAAQAARALANGVVRRIDVGVVNGRPFLITCSTAWDAAIVRSFEKMPVRGIVPYVFAGVYEFFEYRTQPFTVMIDEVEELQIEDPMVCTVANLSQYGGGAIIAPSAEPDDGILELVVACKRDMPVILANIGRLMGGSIAELPKVISRRFRSLHVDRPRPAPIQVDGELVHADAQVEISVKPRAINVLVPSSQHPS